MGVGVFADVAEYCYCLWGCLTSSAILPFIMHVRQTFVEGPALLVEQAASFGSSCGLASGPWELHWARCRWRPRRRLTVLPSRKLKWILVIGRGLGASWTSLLCSLETKVPFFIFGDILLSHLFQTVLSRLRGWKSDLCSPSSLNLVTCICVRWMWGFLCGWWGGNGHPPKITYLKKTGQNVQETEGTAFTKKEQKSCEQSSFYFK